MESRSDVQDNMQHYLLQGMLYQKPLADGASM